MMQYSDLNPRYAAMTKELIELIGEAAGNVMMSQITITADDPTELSSDFVPGHEYPLIQIKMTTTGAGTYEHLFLIDKSLAGLIYSWMTSADVPEDLGDEHYASTQDIAKQIADQLQTAMAEDESAFAPSDIVVSEIDSSEALTLPEGGLVATYKFKKSDAVDEFQVTHAIQGELSETAAAEAEEAGEKGAEGAGEEAAETDEDAAEGAGEEPAAEAGEDDLMPDTGDDLLSDDGLEDDFGIEDFGGEGDEIPDESSMDMDNIFGGDDIDDETISGPTVQASPADFGEFGQTTPVNGEPGKISMLLDVELDVSVELGRKIMLVDEILKLGKGSVIELDKLAGEPVDVLVNGKKLAEGEVVVIEDHFGVRLTHLLDATERIKSLGR